jgi:hypothetical protein
MNGSFTLWCKLKIDYRFWKSHYAYVIFDPTVALHSLSLFLSVSGSNIILGILFKNILYVLSVT